MSYDILLRRQISGSVARDDTSNGDLKLSLLPLALGLATSAVVAWVAFGGARRVGRAVEKTYYRKTWRDLAATQETPAVTMRELVYDPREEL
jgi:hypothetical protein